MFQFTPSPSAPYTPLSEKFSDTDATALPAAGCPIRTFTDQSLLAATRDFSQLATSFLGTRYQGIHHEHFLTRNFRHSMWLQSRYAPPIAERCFAVTPSYSFFKRAVLDTSRLRCPEGPLCLHGRTELKPYPSAPLARRRRNNYSCSEEQRTGSTGSGNSSRGGVPFP